MSYQPQLPKPGELVEVRRRRYVVVDVTPDTLPPDVLSAKLFQSQNLVLLSSVEDDALGEDLQVIWEIEPGARIIEDTHLPQPVGFDTPQRLDTFLNAVRWGAASSADVPAFFFFIPLPDEHISAGASSKCCPIRRPTDCRPIVKPAHLGVL